MKAAVESKSKGTTHLSRIQFLVNNIVPGLSGLNNSLLSSEDYLTQAIEANVRWSMKQLLDTPEGRQGAREGRKKLMGAVFEINSGRVRFLHLGDVLALQARTAKQSATRCDSQVLR